MVHIEAPERGAGDGGAVPDRADAEFTQLGTVGVEEEFFLVDDAGHPTGGAHRLVDRRLPAPLVGHLDTEVYDCLLETKTAVCGDAASLRRDALDRRRALASYADRFGYDIAAAGLHPTHGPGDPDTTPKPRYRAMTDRLRFPQRRNTTAGLHIHVGVDDADTAVWVANELRWYVPILLALAANSPFYDGRDTGLASARANIFGALPNTGMPPHFDSYADLRQFRETMVATGSVSDTGQLWWDVRVQPEYGTVELRATDAQFDLDVVAALAEFARALVVDLAERHVDGESGTDYRTAYLAENKWRALRYGHRAQFVDRDGDGVVTLGEVVGRATDRLDVDGVADLLTRPSGATRQRTACHERGLPGVCDLLRVSPSRAKRDERPATRAT